jgi:hypothetical protein
MIDRPIDRDDPWRKALATLSLLTSLLVSAQALVVAAATPASAQGITERVSIGLGGAQGNSESFGATISANARYVAFQSKASNLVPGDTNGQRDVFVRDRQAGTTERVSVGIAGTQADSGSYVAAISADGRFVAFVSNADNLVPDDTNLQNDIFVRDRQAGTTERVNVGLNGDQANSTSDYPGISANGRFVAFTSLADNLVSGDNNGDYDVFVRDRQAGTTQRVNVGVGGVQTYQGGAGAAISANGRFVAFNSTGALVSGDTNGVSDVFLHDQKAETTRRMSRASGGQQGNGHSYNAAVSATARFIAFASEASNLVQGDNNGKVDIFVRDRQTSITTRVSLGWNGSQANGRSLYTAISEDGRFVAFTSLATNLVSRDTNRVDDVFLRDRQTATTQRVSVGPGGMQGNAKSYGPAIALDGRVVAFTSRASNLVPVDTNKGRDVFVRVLSP